MVDTDEPLAKAPEAPPARALAELGVAAAIGVVGALLGSTPAVVRGGHGGLGLWLALAVRLVLPGMLLAWVVRGALRAVRARVPPAGVAGAVGAAFVVSVVCLSSFAAVGFVLQKTTHHRPLAGTTFGVAAALAALAAGVAATHLASWARQSPARQRAFLYVGALATVAVTWIFAVALRRAGGLPPEIAPLAADLLAFGAPILLLSAGVRLATARQ
jgi:hypothetical protein